MGLRHEITNDFMLDYTQTKAGHLRGLWGPAETQPGVKCALYSLHRLARCSNQLVSPIKSAYPNERILRRIVHDPLENSYIKEIFTILPG